VVKKRLFLRSLGLERQRSIGLQLLKRFYPHITFAKAYAWRLAHYIRISHFRSFRFALGLPAKSQRTHSNARSARRGHGEHLGVLAKLVQMRLFF
jgi:hypothetical protein